MTKIVYDVETAHFGGHGNRKKKKNKERNPNWKDEKRHIALRFINNASVLIDATTTFKQYLEKSPDSQLKEALEKVDGVIEDMKREFKKNYFP